MSVQRERGKEGSPDFTGAETCLGTPAFASCVADRQSIFDSETRNPSAHRHVQNRAQRTRSLFENLQGRGSISIHTQAQILNHTYIYARVCVCVYVFSVRFCEPNTSAFDYEHPQWSSCLLSFSENPRLSIQILSFFPSHSILPSMTSPHTTNV